MKANRSNERGTAMELTHSLVVGLELLLAPEGGTGEKCRSVVFVIKIGFAFLLGILRARKDC